MNLMDAFDVGRKIKGRGAAPAFEGVMEDFSKQNEFKQKAGLEYGLTRAKYEMENSPEARQRKLEDELNLAKGKSDIETEAKYSPFYKLIGGDKSSIDSQGQSGNLGFMNKIQKQLGTGVTIDTPWGSLKGTKEGSSQKDALAETTSAHDLVTTLEQTANSIGDIGNPLQAKGKSIWENLIGGGGRSQTGNAKKVSQSLQLYNSMVPAGSAAAYRAVTGDKRLSDQDAQTRAVPLMWKPGESEEIKKLKFGIMRRALAKREARLSSGQYTEVQDPSKGTLYLTDDIYSEALKELANSGVDVGETNPIQSNNDSSVINIQQEIDDAKKAISAGAPGDKVAEEFKRRTGKDLF